MSECGPFSREKIGTGGKVGAERVELSEEMAARRNVQCESVTCDKEC